VTTETPKHEDHLPETPSRKHRDTNQSLEEGGHHPRSADDEALLSRSANEAIGPDATEQGGGRVGSQASPIDRNTGANREDAEG
jgi:hypothetical protein